MMIGSGMAERYHQRFFNMVDLPEGTTLEVATDRIAGFNVAGPKARDLLQRLTNADLSNEAFRFMRSATIEVAGVTCLAIRVSALPVIWDGSCTAPNVIRPGCTQRCWTAANAAGWRPGRRTRVGDRCASKRVTAPGVASTAQEYWPQEVGLCGADQTGQGLPAQGRLSFRSRTMPHARCCRSSRLRWSDDADATGGEPIFTPDGTPVGRVTSGAYGYSVGKSLALGFRNPKAAKSGDTVEIFILGKPHKATILNKPPFDPKGHRLRDIQPMLAEPAQ